MKNVSDVICSPDEVVLSRTSPSGLLPLVRPFCGWYKMHLLSLEGDHCNFRICWISILEGEELQCKSDTIHQQTSIKYNARRNFGSSCVISSPIAVFLCRHRCWIKKCPDKYYLSYVLISAIWWTFLGVCEEKLEDPTKPARNYCLKKIRHSLLKFVWANKFHTDILVHFCIGITRLICLLFN